VIALPVIPAKFRRPLIWAGGGVQPGRVIGAWRKEQLTGPGDTRNPDAIRIATELGALIRQIFASAVALGPVMRMPR